MDFGIIIPDTPPPSPRGNVGKGGVNPPPPVDLLVDPDKESQKREGIVSILSFKVAFAKVVRAEIDLSSLYQERMMYVGKIQKVILNSLIALGDEAAKKELLTAREGLANVMVAINDQEMEVRNLGNALRDEYNKMVLHDIQVERDVVESARLMLETGHNVNFYNIFYEALVKGKEKSEKK